MGPAMPPPLLASVHLAFVPPGPLDSGGACVPPHATAAPAVAPAGGLRRAPTRTLIASIAPPTGPMWPRQGPVPIRLIRSPPPGPGGP